MTALVHTLGQRSLASHRKKRGMTLRDFADLLGCSASMVCRIESGQRAPGKALMLRAEQKLGIHPIQWYRPAGRK
ncbi:MAG: helix-turn-helix transcriptional regulator [Candidatus Rokubacteria bacterium]|nr:helix-turn-helix transcriptional regulator [Candidatus Rokubacteria bacterium]